VNVSQYAKYLIMIGLLSEVKGVVYGKASERFAKNGKSLEDWYIKSIKC